MNIDALDKITLSRGAHDSRESGMCAMEAAAWIAGEPHGDHPACVCPTIGAFVRAWNDGLPSDADRNRLLKPLLPVILNTAGSSDLAVKRSYMVLNWYFRRWLPAFLTLRPETTVHANALRQTPEISDSASLSAAHEHIAAAGAAAGDAAGDTAWVAAWAASRDASRDTAWVAAWAASRAAAGDAAWVAAGAAARDAVRDAAMDAVRDAARAAARAAVRDVAGDVLTPIVKTLQDEAAQLVRDMAGLK